MVAELVDEEAGFTMVLDETDVEQMHRESKAIVTQRWRHGPKVTEAEFTHPDHPLHAFYREFRTRLALERRT